MEAAIIIACLLFSAFFSGMETAFLAANKVYLGVERQQNSFVSRILGQLTLDPVAFLAAMLIGNSLALVVYGYHAGIVVMRWLLAGGVVAAPLLLVLQVAISGFLIILTADFLPKVFFQVYANRLIRIFAVPAYLFYVLFSPVTRVVIGLSDFLLKYVFRMRENLTRSYLSRGELGDYVNPHHNFEEEQEETDAEIRIFRNAMVFSDRVASEVMTPRSEIAAVSIQDTISDLRRLFADTGFSKIMVYQHKPENIIGYVHSFELFNMPENIARITIPVEKAEAGMPVKDLLSSLSRSHKSVALITADDGSPLGIITIEDIVEELFGEIEDEHDDIENAVEVANPDGSFTFSARLMISFLNLKYGLDLPVSDHYRSLGGFIIYHYGSIPKEGAVIAASGFRLTVVKGSSKMIETVNVAHFQAS